MTKITQARQSAPSEIKEILHPLISEWFFSKFREFSLPQKYGVLAIWKRKNILISAETGGTKTLTAFLSILNNLVILAEKHELKNKVYAVYTSPLKALSNDIHKNLIEPLKEIAKIAREHHVIVHTDAVASTGNIPLDVKELGVDLLSMAAHQFYGPKGAGALYVREGLRIVPLIYGGIQESGRRAGTENVPAIVGMGKAAELAKQEMEERMEQVKKDCLIFQLI